MLYAKKANHGLLLIITHHCYTGGKPQLCFYVLKSGPVDCITVISATD